MGSLVQEMSEYSNEDFIKAVQDIATNGWQRSTLSEKEKYKSCGQIMSSLPDKWVKAVFQAAVKGVNKEDSSSLTSEDNFIEKSTNIVEDNPRKAREFNSEDSKLIQSTQANNSSNAKISNSSHAATYFDINSI